MDRETRLAVFRELIDCAFRLPLWRCDAELTLPADREDALPFALLRAHGQAEAVRAHAVAHEKPLILTGLAGLVWIVMPERTDGQWSGCSVLGPMRISEPDPARQAAELHTLRLPPEQEQPLLQRVREAPLLPLGRVTEAALMLHYCVTGQKIAVSDLHYRQSALPTAPQEEERTLHGTWAAEQELLRMVREGDIGYRAQTARVASVGPTGQLAVAGDALRQVKNAVEVGVTLFSRAAIAGGLPPETGLTLCDRYFQSVEACDSVAELTAVSHTMQEDFVQRVHRIRTQGRYSPAVQACVDYIDLHLEEPLPLPELSRLFHYSDYYFTHKFKLETGCTPKAYIRRRRLERAAFLLRATQESIQAIGDHLQFCSASYFAEQFRQAYGQTPAAYRNAAAAGEAPSFLQTSLENDSNHE